MKTEYRLIYKGQEDQSLDSRSIVIDLLRDHYGLGRVIELNELLDNPPFLVKRSQSKTELESDIKKLQGIGANAVILSSIENTQKLAERISKERSPSQLPKKESGFHAFFRKYSDKLHSILSSINTSEVEDLAREIISARKRNSQIVIFGNGGSAAAASHLVTDLAKQRFNDEKSLFRVLSLTDNVPWLTATGNDIGYDNIFLAQMKNLLQPDDLVIAISSSGNSPNILKAVDYANQKCATTYGIVGFDGGELLQRATKSVYIPTKKGHYGYMEDVSSILIHMISIYIYEHDCSVFGKTSKL